MKDYGSPAFPVAIWDKEKMRYINDGMTLRDYFAAKAMHAYISNPRFDYEKKETIARGAYSFADAMLIERVGT